MCFTHSTLSFMPPLLRGDRYHQASLYSRAIAIARGEILWSTPGIASNEDGSETVPIVIER
jgi:hypothetical protein